MRCLLLLKLIKTINIGIKTKPTEVPVLIREPWPLEWTAFDP